MKKRAFLFGAFLFCGVLLIAQEKTTEIASAKPTADKLTVTDIPPVTASISLPAGTAIRMRLSRMVTTFNRPGDRFSGSVTEAVSYQGRVIIPAGSTVQGEVMRTSSPRRIKGRPMIDLHPELVTLPSGNSYLISATVVDTGDPKTFDVNEEGQIRGPGHSRNDVVIGGIGTGFGLGVGALAAGPEGALIGAGVGATASTVRWLMNHNELVVPPGTELILELNRPMSSSSQKLAQ